MYYRGIYDLMSRLTVTVLDVLDEKPGGVIAELFRVDIDTGQGGVLISTTDTVVESVYWNGGLPVCQLVFFR